MAAEELQNYKTKWERHFDILQMQEAALFERLYSRGCDPRMHDDYDSCGEKFVAQWSTKEKEAWNRADQAISLRYQQQEENQQQQGNGSASSSSSSCSASSSAHYSEKKVEWHEAVVEEDTEGKLPEYEQLARTDEDVQRIANDDKQYAPLDESLYPASFAHVVPKSVLNALVHAK